MSCTVETAAPLIANRVDVCSMFDQNPSCVLGEWTGPVTPVEGHVEGVVLVVAADIGVSTGPEQVRQGLVSVPPRLAPGSIMKRRVCRDKRIMEHPARNTYAPETEAYLVDIHTKLLNEQPHHAQVR